MDGFLRCNISTIYGGEIVIPVGGTRFWNTRTNERREPETGERISATVPREDFLEHARKPKSRVLRRTLEHLGHIEQLRTPWLRVAPKFHRELTRFKH
jgi:hypothetical protein